MAEAEAAGFRKGQVIEGKYAIDRVLGQGSVGVVVVAEHLQLRRRVALKFLLPEHLAKPDVVSRFTREARVAARMQNEHVARVLDVGNEHGTPFIVLEHLEGQDLKQLLASRGPLPVEEAVRYVCEACEALTEAHAIGLVHRDLKPANLFLASRPVGKPVLKVLDFGVSKVMSPSTSSELSLSMKMAGSPSYMSPEQLRMSPSLDGRSDVWALGVVLYELLTRERPFRAESLPALMGLILSEPYVRLDTRRPALPPGLVNVVHRCLEKDPAARFSTAGDLAFALAPFAPPQSSLAGVTDTGPPSSMPPAPQRRDPRVLFAALAVWGTVLAVTAFLVTLRLFRPSEPVVTAAPPPPSTSTTVAEQALALVPLIPTAERAAAPEPPAATDDAGQPVESPSASASPRPAPARAAAPHGTTSRQGRPDQQDRLNALQRLCDQGTVTATECAAKRLAILREH